MAADVHTLLPLLGAVGAGVMTGFFATWSHTILPALDRTPADAAVAAMTAANEAVKTPLFALGYAGTPVLLAASAVVQAVAGRWWPGTLLGAGAVLYTAGVLGLTAAVHLPLNDRLARADGGAARAWREFAPPGRRWHQVRAAASGAAFVLALLAPVVAAPG